MPRSRTTLTLAALASLTLVGAAPPHHLSRCLNSQVKGITQTLPDGTIVGEPDKHDWGCAEKGSGANDTGAEADARLAGPGARVAVPGASADVPVPPPTAVCIEPAAPNPADAGTRLQFSLPAAAHVSLIVRHGKRPGSEPAASSIVRTLVDGQLAAGLHSVYWDLTNELGERLAPGIYRATLVVDDEALCGDIEVR